MMRNETVSGDDLIAENRDLRARLEEAEETLRAIRDGEVDALLVATSEGDRIFTLQGAEHPYRVLVETMNEGAVTAAEDGTILYCNSRFAAMVKAAPETIVGSSLSRYVAGEDRRSVEALMACPDQAHRRQEVQLACSDGTSIPALFSFSPAAIEGLPGVCAIVTDLSEQKLTEQIMASEKLARSILEQVTEAIVVCDREGRIIRASMRAHDLAGCNLLMKPVETVFPFLVEGAGAAAHDGAYPASPFLPADKWGILRREVLFRRNNGIKFDLLYSTAWIKNEEGRSIGSVITLVDVTRTKRVEKELRSSEERLNLAINAARLYLWEYFVAEGRGLYSNLLQDMLGYGPSKEETTMASFLNLMHPDDRGRVMEQFSDHMSGKSPFINANYRILAADGTWRWVNTRGNVVEWDEAGNAVRVMGIHLDINEVQLQRLALKNASEKLNLLSSITRHDILNQVSAQKAFLALLEDHIPQDEETQGLYRHLLTTSDTIRRQIAFTGDYQHMGERDPVWQDTLYVLKHAAESVYLENTTLAVDEGLPEVLADPMLEKAFFNLLENSLRHGGEVSRIAVHWQADGRYGILILEDDGVGIPEDEKTRIFERGIGKNTGLGLFLTKEILGITGISIRECGEEGKGARFEIAVPKGKWRATREVDGTSPEPSCN
jgi:PAS domain S-box-containing protein